MQKEISNERLIKFFCVYERERERERVKEKYWESLSTNERKIEKVWEREPGSVDLVAEDFLVPILFHFPKFLFLMICSLLLLLLLDLQGWKNLRIYSPTFSNFISFLSWAAAAVQKSTFLVSAKTFFAQKSTKNVSRLFDFGLIHLLPPIPSTTTTTTTTPCSFPIFDHII